MCLLHSLFSSLATCLSMTFNSLKNIQEKEPRELQLILQVKCISLKHDFKEQLQFQVRATCT